MKFFQRQDGARIGRKPFDRAIGHRHWENPEPIPLQQDFRVNHRRVTSGRGSVTSQETRARAESETYHWSLVTDHFLKYSSRLKAFAIVFFLGAVIFIEGCADPLEKPMLEEVPAKFQRGITGNGTLGPMDRSTDPSIKDMHP